MGVKIIFSQFDSLQLAESKDIELCRTERIEEILETSGGIERTAHKCESELRRRADLLALPQFRKNVKQAFDDCRTEWEGIKAATELCGSLGFTCDLLNLYSKKLL